MKLNKPIYYLTSELKQMVDKDFEFVQDIPWYKVFKDPKTDEYWRLTTPDKYQTDYMVKVPKGSNWENFDSRELEIDLLKQNRGESENKCIWQNCDNKALNDIVYCASHAFNEMNIRE
mgnify:CR=1 FL=1|tara:strand:- start:437 stop:790 length:354 start_codon:yes stop_codon:yes gene_type:complete